MDQREIQRRAGLAATIRTVIATLGGFALGTDWAWMFFFGRLKEWWLLFRLLAAVTVFGAVWKLVTFVTQGLVIRMVAAFMGLKPAQK